MVDILERVFRRFELFAEELGGIVYLFIETLVWMVRPPFRLTVILKQMEFIGVQSGFIVFLTGIFTGMVFALQTSYAFRLFAAENLVGPSVALALSRELAPVLTGLMVTGRAGSAIAAELGTMKVTEQIDALYSMAISPVQYLVFPRVISAVIMVPLLAVLFQFVGFWGSYFVGVYLLDLNSYRFIQDTVYALELKDVYTGLVKAAFFGLTIAVVGCYKGFYAEGGAEGVGKAATHSVVISSVTILVSDYFLTALMFGR